MINANVKKSGSFLQRLRKEMRTHPTLYLLMIPFVLYYILFDYVPMYGVAIAFQDYNVVKGIGGSDMWHDAVEAGCDADRLAPINANGIGSNGWDNRTRLVQVLLSVINVWGLFYVTP